MKQTQENPCTQKVFCIRRFAFVLSVILSFAGPSFSQNVLDKAGLSVSAPAIAAYSVRQLSTAYSGPALEVRRSSDNAIQSIGFSGNDLNITQLMAFVGSGDGFVTTWYDQSGNNYHAVQTNNAYQAKIVSAGVLILNNTRPAISFSGITNHNLFAPIPATAYPISMNVLANTGGGTTINGAFMKFGTSNDGIGVGVGASELGTNSLGGNIILLKEQASWCPSSPRVLYPSTVFTSTTIQQASGLLNNYVNGMNIPLSGATTNPKPITGSFYIGGYTEGSKNRYAAVKESEVIVLSTSLNLSERTALECNQQNYFAIKLIGDQAATVCSGEFFIATPGNSTYSWSDPIISPVGAVTGFTPGASSNNFSQTLFNTTTADATATYTIIPACGVPFTYNITVRTSAVPALSIEEDYCTIGNGKIKLTASPVTFSSYLWSNDSTQDHIIIEQSGIYTLDVTDVNGCSNRTSINVGNELVKNGDFSQGRDVGYTTGYPYVTSTANSPTYTISSNAQTAHSNFWGRDHTSGTGNFMIVNSEGTNYTVWETTVKVDSGARYYFSAWAMSLNAAGPYARLVFNVDGQNVGTVAVLDTGVQNNNNKGWTKFYGQWDAGYRDAANDSITIRMVNLQAGNAGNDFGLDDISFSTLPPISFFGATLGNGGNSVCTGQSLQLTSQLQGGRAPFTYTWKDPANNLLPNEPNPFVASPIAGIYTLEAVDSDNCPANAEINIILGNPNLDSIRLVNQCSANLLIDAYGLIPNSINLKLYYTITTIPTATIDSVLVDANAAGVGRFMLPIPSDNAFYSNKIITIDSISNGSCKAFPAKSKNLGTTYGNTTWRGGSAGEWNIDANWCPGVPGYNLNVTIPSNSVVTVKQNQVAVCGNLTLQSGARLVLEEGASLWYYGTISVGSGAQIDARQGTIQMLREGDQTLTGSAFVDSSVRNLIINPYSATTVSNNRLITLSATGTPLQITGALLFFDPKADLKTNGKLILSSTAAGTARVGPLAAGNAILDSVIVERYIPAGRKWQFLATPANTVQTIKQAWQEGATSPLQNARPGYGFLIGNHMTNPGNNFDMINSNGPSVKTYNPLTDSWVAIGSTTDSIKSERGYMAFITGDRSAVSNTSTTLRITGLLKQQSQAAVSIPQGEYHAVGNPYASPVKLADILRSNVQNTFVVWDPKLGGSYGLGAYQYLTYDEDAGIYFATPGGGSYPELLPDTNAVITPINVLESGQAFFIRAENTGGDGSVQFTESAKAGSSENMVFRLNGFTGTGPRIFATLQANNNGGFKTTDGIIARFGQNYHDTVGSEDLLKIANTNENVSVTNGSSQLSIDNRGTVSAADTVFLRISGLRVQQYRWRINAFDVETANLQPVLVDRYTGTETALAPGMPTFYTFSIENIAGSYNPARFIIVFKSLVVLPVSFSKLEATRNANKTATVRWTTETETNMLSYELQKSFDGGSFAGISTHAALYNNSSRAVYDALDAAKDSRVVFYRIKAISNDGQVQYSNTVKLNAGKALPAIAITPNPVKDGQLNISFSDAATGKYEASLISISGQAVLKKMLTLSAANAAVSLRIPNLPAGNYTIILKNENGDNYTEQMIVE